MKNFINHFILFLRDFASPRFNIRQILCVLFISCGFLISFIHPIFSNPSNAVHFIQLDDDTINPVTAEYITGAIDRAVNNQAVCLIIKLDTPGGLLSSTRRIVKKILTAKVPVVVYISPSGSRAGSAGVFITYASHVAAMAPSTNIGAAHPVRMGGGSLKGGNWQNLKKMVEDLKSNIEKSKESKEVDGEIGEDEKQIQEAEFEIDHDPMSSKILQDTTAFIRSIAKDRGRNMQWAVQSVTKSLSITSSEALEKGVVEIVATSDQDLLSQLDGRVVSVDGQQVTLRTKDAYITRTDMDARQIFFNILANPNIAYFLMILGFYGLLFEVTHPGIGVPGILGCIFLILAFYSMQTLPTNYAGLALLVLGLILLIAEAFIPGFGLLTLGGIVCMILGSMLLFESVDPIMRVSRAAIFAFALSWAGITFFLVRSVIGSRREKVHGGKEGLIGEIATVRTSITPEKKGKVFVHGEIWIAYSDDSLNEEDEVVVVEVKGLKVKVKKS